jgi:hypothetical protein
LYVHAITEAHNIFTLLPEDNDYALINYNVSYDGNRYISCNITFHSLPQMNDFCMPHSSESKCDITFTPSNLSFDMDTVDYRHSNTINNLYCGYYNSMTYPTPYEINMRVVMNNVCFRLMVPSTGEDCDNTHAALSYNDALTNCALNPFCKAIVIYRPFENIGHRYYRTVFGHPYKCDHKSMVWTNKDEFNSWDI